MTTRYTLSLPEPIYEELKETASKYDRSIKELVTQCLKFGLVAIKLEDNRDAEIVLREQVKENGHYVTKESVLHFIW